MSTRIAILGAGPGGYVAAVRAAQLGAEVTVIEEDNVGGTCLNWGCIPSKIMIRTAGMLHDFQRAQEYGIAVEGAVGVDMQRLMARKQALLQNQRKGILKLLEHHKIRCIKGSGFVEGHGMVSVRPPDGPKIEVPWDKLILATGTRPFDIPAFPFDSQRILSSNHALGLQAVPGSILIVGGGVIGCEFAFMLSCLGARVTVVEAMPRVLPLPSVDEACSTLLLREMKKRKIKVILNRTVEACQEEEGRLRVVIGPSPLLKNPSEKDRAPLSETVDQMLVCIGRAPNSNGIGLENLGVALDARGWVGADDRLQTNVNDVYAIGDLLGPEKVMLAHVASSEGQVAAQNAMGGDGRMDYALVPGAIFTLPEVANVGLTESQARAAGHNTRVDSVLFRTLGKAQVTGDIAGEARIVSDAGSGKILGVHIVGPHATDLIAEGALALKMGGTVQDLASTIHAHPTLAEIMLETAFKALDHSLHG